MKIDIKTLEKVSGFGDKMKDKVIKQHLIDTGKVDLAPYIRSNNNIKPNTIHNVDSIEYLSYIPSESIDLVVTDPPYRTTSRGNAGNSGGMLQKDINKSGQVFSFNNVNIQDYMYQLYRILKDGSHFYIMTNHTNLVEMLNIGTNAGFHFIKDIIWDKGNKIMGQYYMSQYEHILFFRKGKGIKINNCGTSDIISVPNIKDKDSDGNNLHDTQKPVELMQILIENSSQVGDVVLDPFMGIGSTIIACKKTDRKFIGMEIDQKYFSIVQDKLDSHETNMLL